MEALGARLASPFHGPLAGGQRCLFAGRLLLRTLAAVFGIRLGSRCGSGRLLRGLFELLTAFRQ